MKNKWFKSCKINNIHHNKNNRLSLHKCNVHIMHTLVIINRRDHSQMGSITIIMQLRMELRMGNNPIINKKR